MLAEITTHDLTAWWAPALAFAAGLLSFASPCVFPLVPGYVSFISGDRAAEDRSPPLVPILLFIAGFAAVFTALGAFSTALVPAVKGTTGQRIAGVVVVAFGALMLATALQRGSIRLYAERRPFLEKVRPGPAWAAPLGMAFAAGWTPRIGPVLGGILGIASQGGTARGMLLLLCYSAGLGVPFLLVGLGVQRFMGAFAWVKRHYRVIAGVSGGLLIAVGLLLVTGRFTRLFARFSGFAWL
jgi:cytochrome c-type biogenesis protein